MTAKLKPRTGLQLKTSAVGGAESSELARQIKKDSTAFVRQSKRARAHPRGAGKAKKGTAGPALDNVPSSPGQQADALVLGKRLDARYALVEVNHLLISHDPQSFAANPEYPAELQERDYARDPHERLKVATNAQNLIPEYLINTNPDAVNGPPMVLASRVVVGGNSRAMIVDLAYRDGRAAPYRALLVARAKIFGIAVAELDKYKHPILIRVISEAGVDLKKLTRDLDESLTQDKDYASDAVSLGARISDRSWGVLSAASVGFSTLRAYLSSPRSSILTSELVRDGVIEQRNAGRLLRQDGRPTEDGRAWISRAVVGAILTDSDLIAALSPAQIVAIERAAPAIVTAGYYGHDLKSEIQGAARWMAEADRRGTSIAALAKQTTMLTRNGWPGLELAAVWDESAVRFLEVVRESARIAERSPADQTGLFGGPPLKPFQVLTEAIAVTTNRGDVSSSATDRANITI